MLHQTRDTSRIAQFDSYRGNVDLRRLNKLGVYVLGDGDRGRRESPFSGLGLYLISLYALAMNSADGNHAGSRR